MGLIKKLKRYKKQVNIYKQNSISIPRTKNIRLDIAGKDNKIIINTKSIRQSGRINIRIYGDNNTIVIGENVSGNLNYTLATITIIMHLHIIVNSRLEKIQQLKV